MENILPVLCFTAFIVGLIAAVVTFVRRSFELIPEGSFGIIERGGKFQGIVPPGRHLLMPLDRIREYVPLQEFTETMHADQVVAKEASVIGLDMDVNFRVAHYTPVKVSKQQHSTMQPVAVLQWKQMLFRERDVFSVVYRTDNWKDKAKQEAVTAMFDHFLTVDLEHTIFGTDPSTGLKDICDAIRTKANAKINDFGAEISRITIYNVTPDERTQMALTSRRRIEEQHRLRMMQVENHLIIKQQLNFTNDDLLKWWEIQSRWEAGGAPPGPATGSNSSSGNYGSPLSLTAPIQTRPPGQGGGGNTQGSGNK